jgi:hypothetical protein
MSDTDHDDMMQAVRDAMDAHQSDSPPVETNLPEDGNKLSTEDAEQISAAVTAKINADEQQRSDQPASKNRDGRGRFASTNPAAPDAATETAFSPPTSWTAEAKAEWEKLPPHLQDAVLKREMEIDNGFRQHSDERQRLKEIDNLIAPRRQTFQQYGMKSDAEAIERLLTISDGFSQNPVGTLQFLAQSFGIKPEQLFGAAQAGPSQEQLQSMIAQERAQAVAQYEVQMFEQNAPEHYSLVRPIMQQLLQSGHANNMQDAYQKAIRHHPGVLSIEQKRQAASRRERQVRATNASLNGAPHGVPAAPARNGKASGGRFGDIADDVRAAMNSLI